MEGTVWILPHTKYNPCDTAYEDGHVVTLGFDGLTIGIGFRSDEAGRIAAIDKLIHELELLRDAADDRLAESVKAETPDLCRWCGHGDDHIAVIDGCDACNARGGLCEPTEAVPA